MTENGSGPNRRRQMVVNKTLQSRLILEIAWPSIICLAITALVLAWLCRSLVMEAQMAEIELFALVPLMITVIAYLFVSTGFMVFNALKLSHRVAGPMVRFRAVLEAVRNGDTGVRVKLREKDFLAEVATDVNTFLDWVEARDRAASAARAIDNPQGAQDGTGGSDVATSTPASAASSASRAPAADADGSAKD